MPDESRCNTTGTDALTSALQPPRSRTATALLGAGRESIAAGGGAGAGLAGAGPTKLLRARRRAAVAVHHPVVVAGLRAHDEPVAAVLVAGAVLQAAAGPPRLLLARHVRAAVVGRGCPHVALLGGHVHEAVAADVVGAVVLAPVVVVGVAVVAFLGPGGDSVSTRRRAAHAGLRARARPPRVDDTGGASGVSSSSPFSTLLMPSGEDGRTPVVGDAVDELALAT